MNATTKWKFQHDSGSIMVGNATDARGLRLRKECGYTHVKMEGSPDSGWLQIEVAIRKVEMRERFAAVAAS